MSERKRLNNARVEWSGDDLVCGDQIVAGVSRTGAMPGRSTRGWTAWAFGWGADYGSKIAAQRATERRFGIKARWLKKAPRHPRVEIREVRK